jgi:hypothetical protein
MNRFELPPKEVLDEMAEKSPAFFSRLDRQEQAAQTIDREFPPQHERPDLPKGDGDDIRTFGAAVAAQEPAVGGVEAVGSLLFDRHLTGQAVVQNRVVSGELEEADLEKTEERFRRGSGFKELEKIIQEPEERFVLLVFQGELVGQINQAGSGQRPFQIGANRGEMTGHVGALDQGETVRPPAGKEEL